MGPISTGLGQILFYFVEDETGKRTPQEMREIQDWLIKFNLQTVTGVTEVLSLGGEVKQYQIRVRPIDLLRYDLSLSDVVEAVKANNSNVGAQFIVKNAEEYIVRSVGLAEKIPDLENIVLKSKERDPRLPAAGGRGGDRRRGPPRAGDHERQGRGGRRHGPEAHRDQHLDGHQGREGADGRDQQGPSPGGQSRPVLRPGDAGGQVRPDGDKGPGRGGRPHRADPAPHAGRDPAEHRGARAPSPFRWASPSS